MAKRNPDRVDVHVMGGIRVRFEYHNKTRNVVVQPDEPGLMEAGALAVLRVWTTVADWARRFAEANPGWKVNGSHPVEPMLIEG